MKKSTWINGLSLVTQLGVTMIVPILICTLVGNYLDEKINTSPLFMIILLLLGVAAAFRNLFYHTHKQMKKEDKNRKNG